MSTPASLPRPIAAFVTRSRELASADPVISYLCKLYAVEQILSLGLHASDDDIAAFAMGLLDDIETAKTSSSEDFLEVIKDNETSVAYVLNFANKIFGSALMAIQEQRVSKQTAMSLMAVVNFFELLQLWKEEAERVEDLEETSKKVKYAKYHAARILKTLKSGGDPNDYVPPKNDFAKEEVDEGEDQDDDEGNQAQFQEQIAPDEASLPIVEPEGSNSDNFGLPSVPTTISQSTSPQNPPKFIDEEPQQEYEDDDESTSSAFKLPEAPTFSPSEKDEVPFTLPEPPREPPKSITPTITHLAPTPKKAEPQKEINIKEILESSEIYSKAQKHAKFAISAMNYEDKSTAIKELQSALEMLTRLNE